MKILIAGDFYPRRRIQILLNKKDFSFLDEVKQYTQKADYSIVNFEGCVADENDSPIEKTGPNLRCDERSVEAIKYAGFNAVTLANNHFYDFGDAGVEKSLSAFKEYGLDHVGGGATIEEAQSILYKHFEDGTLAVINVCEKEFTIASTQHGGSAPMDLPNVYRSIQVARRNADFILVITHGGIEVYPYPTPRMKSIYRFFIEAGADAVVNHHQHCINGYEEYNGKPIFYGLGNFCFDWITASVKWWEEGYMVLLSFNKQSTSFELIPYLQFSAEPKLTFSVSREEFFDEIEQLNKVIQDDILLENELKSFALKNNNLVIFEPYLSRITRKLYSLHLLPSFLTRNKIKSILNLVRCESHNEVLQTSLTQLQRKRNHSTGN